MESCEWNPAKDCPATDDDGCKNVATHSVGRRDNWHLCASCMALPRFGRMRYAVSLPRTPRRGDVHRADRFVIPARR